MICLFEAGSWAYVPSAVRKTLRKYPSDESVSLVIPGEPDGCAVLLLDLNPLEEVFYHERQRDKAHKGGN